MLLKVPIGQARWLMPVIPHFGRLRQADNLSSKVQDQPEMEKWKKPISTKYTKISCVWWYTSVIPAT